MIGGINPKALLTQDKDGNLKLDENFQQMIYGDPKMNWKLVREQDGLIKKSSEVIWLEFNEDGTFKQKHDKPAIALSLLMSPFNEFFTWQTTVIVEILEQKEGYLKFRTENSIYELRKL